MITTCHNSTVNKSVLLVWMMSDGHGSSAARCFTCGECLLCTSHGVTELFKVPLHEIFALHDVVLGWEVLHAVFSLQLGETEEVKRFAGGERQLGAVQQRAPGVLQHPEVRVHICGVQLAVGAAVSAHRVGAHVHELILLVHEELVGVARRAHAWGAPAADVGWPQRHGGGSAPRSRRVAADN